VTYTHAPTNVDASEKRFYRIFIMISQTVKRRVSIWESHRQPPRERKDANSMKIEDGEDG
jgi:hypothetical protein